MRILIYSPQFSPQVGGVEVVTEQLARAWVALGATVVVLCHTPDPQGQQYPFAVLRNPHPWRWLRAVQWCDLVVYSCISLKGLWPLLLTGKPWAAIHHTWYRRPDGSLGWPERLKLAVMPWARLHIGVSGAIAAHLPVPARVIENPYADDVFYQISPPGERSQTLIFVGRLVSDKGVDLLITALANLGQRGLHPDLTIIGAGPELPHLQNQVITAGLQSQVQFLGELPPQAVAAQLNQHQILIIPSRWQEPFGIVALEGMACGCVVIGSAGGGLKDAIGPGGMTFPNGDVIQLEEAIATLLTQPHTRTQYHQAAQSHLQAHRRQAIAHQYLQAFQEHR
ncbi:MAG: glycosyltransferase family 1 protein [Spirulina sp. DLM2.Bin59]|nr:MAG: glycosyltransferase family 1 protein [Spirulina sp. DLM2.Bin59]